MTMFSRKHLEDITRAHIVSLMYIPLKSSRASDDLSIVFDGDRVQRRNELTINKNIKCETMLDLCSSTSSVSLNIRKKPLMSSVIIYQLQEIKTIPLCRKLWL